MSIEQKIGKFGDFCLLSRSVFTRYSRPQVPYSRPFPIANLAIGKNTNQHVGLQNGPVPLSFWAGDSSVVSTCVVLANASRSIRSNSRTRCKHW